MEPAPATASANNVCPAQTLSFVVSKLMLWLELREAIRCIPI